MKTTVLLVNAMLWVLQEENRRLGIELHYEKSDAVREALRSCLQVNQRYLKELMKERDSYV